MGQFPKRFFGAKNFHEFWRKLLTNSQRNFLHIFGANFLGGLGAKLLRILGAKFLRILGANFYDANCLALIFYEFLAQTSYEFLAPTFLRNLWRQICAQVLCAKSAKECRASPLACRAREVSEFCRANWAQKARVENRRQFSAPEKGFFGCLVIGYTVTLTRKKTWKKFCDSSPCHA